MRKYKILRAIGCTIKLIGGISAVLMACVDLDKSPELTGRNMLQIWSCITLCIIVGFLLSSFNLVEGFVFSLYITAGAYRYMHSTKVDLGTPRGVRLLRCKMIRDRYPFHTITSCMKMYNVYLIQRDRKRREEEKENR